MMYVFPNTNSYNIFVKFTDEYLTFLFVFKYMFKFNLVYLIQYNTILYYQVKIYKMPTIKHFLFQLFFNA